MLVRVRNFPTMNPWLTNIMDLEQDIDNAFTNLLDEGPVTTYGRYPLFDVAEYENESVIIAEIPGVTKDDLKISIDNGYITVSGERKASGEPEGSTWIRNEIRTGKFSRTIELPHEVETDKISAELNDGILRVTLPKAEKVKPREIKIQ